MSNILITGIGGFVGSHLAEYLYKNTDWNIYGLLRWNEPLDNLVNVKDKIHLIEGDLNDYSSLIRAVQIAKPDYVSHLAAQSYVQASNVYPVKTLQTNVLGTVNMLEAIKNNVPDAIVHNCSSSEVYGRVEDIGPINEDCPLLPASPYSVSKVGQDMMGRYYYEAYHMNVVTTRMFTHTGPRRGDVFFESSFAKQVAMIEVGMESCIKVGNLYSVRTIADVRDAVRAYYMILNDPHPGEIYNIGGNHTCQVGDVLNYLNKGYNVMVSPDRLRPLDANNQIPDYTKFNKAYGWKPEIPFKKTMDDLLNYWRERVVTHVVINR